jgi:predicted DNA-binding transcriptional regulator YafY
LEIGYTNREYTISWILGFGDKVKILEPPDMATEIKEIAAEIYKKYS